MKAKVYQLSMKQLQALETLLESEGLRVDAVHGPIHYKTVHSLYIKGLVERKEVEVDGELVDSVVPIDEEKVREAVATRQVVYID